MTLIAYVGKRGKLMHCATPPIGSEFQLLLPWLAFSRPLGLPACIKPIFLYISKAREPAARFQLGEPSRHY